MSAPMGIRHGKATVPFATVEKARDMHEFEGYGYKRVAKALGINLSTAKDWLLYRTRTHG